MTPVFGIVGAGKVGATLGRLWNERGFHTGAVYSRTLRHADDLAASLGTSVVGTVDDVVSRCDLTVLTVPDDAIAMVAAEVSTPSLAGKGVIHTSGAHSTDVLDSLRQRGAMVGSLHPAFPFASVDAAVAGLPGTTFAVEASDRVLKDWLVGLVGAVNGQLIEIPAGKKALYHAALAIASNYTVVLYHAAARLLEEIDADRGAARNALDALLAATVQNLAESDPAQALTGPLGRGDMGTIRRHLQALTEYPDIAGAYMSLARAAEPLLRERGQSEEQIGYLEQILNE